MTAINTSHIKIGLTDINGVLRSKYLAREKFDKALKTGFGFCDVIVGSDINDQLIDKLHFTGWHTGYPDAHVNIIEASKRSLPLEDNRLFYLCEFSSQNAHFCPRHTLKSIVEKATTADLTPIAGMEFEFTLFDETPSSIHQKQFRDLTPLTPGNCGYSLLRTSQLSPFYDELLEYSEEMGVPLEGLHTEIGPGVLEAALSPSPILEACDRAVLFKTLVKTLAHRHGFMASFMAKWSPIHQGQSGHIHLSLLNKNKQNVFYDPKQPHQISETLRHCIGGQQQLMPAFLALSAPFINSYARLVPGFWAPTQATWGIDNRTCALRAIPAGQKSHRVEYRIPAADCNPYLAMSAALASALYGIENKITPSPEIKGNAYEQSLPEEYQLPTNIIDAATHFRQSSIAKNYFDQHFIDDYATTREWEAHVYQKAVTDWQLERYFELA
jgi:glutamine synthetase